MAFKIINDGTAAVLNLEKDKKENIIIDFYLLSQMMVKELSSIKCKLTYISISEYFSDNEHDLISDYLGRKVSLNDMFIEDIIDLEDAVDAYLLNVFCKNLPKF